MTVNDTMMDPDIYPNPHQWDPDRWLDDGELHNRLDAYWTPFGRGPRMCQGVESVSLFSFSLSAYRLLLPSAKTSSTVLHGQSSKEHCQPYSVVMSLSLWT